MIRILIPVHENIVVYQNLHRLILPMLLLLHNISIRLCTVAGIINENIS